MSKTASLFGKRVQHVDKIEFIPWVEKYRPRTMDEVSHQEEVVRTLKKSIETGNLPHLLFYGPPGTGKTSTILAIARDLYGHELLKSRVLELNASDERGINVVRTKVKSFSQIATSTSSGSGRGPPGYKLVILDEADAMTSDAQTALRRTMETYSKTTRFCLICNYVSRIIEPLASRCAKFRFKPLEADTMKERIRHICEQEDEMLDSLATVANGDMRKAITYLQSAYRLHGSDVTAEAIVDIAGVMPANLLQDLMAACRSNSFDQLQAAVTNVVSLGFPANAVVSQMFDFVLQSTEFNDKMRSLIAQKLGEVDKCIVDGSDEFLQLLDACACIMRIVTDPSNTILVIDK